MNWPLVQIRQHLNLPTCLFQLSLERRNTRLLKLPRLPCEIRVAVDMLKLAHLLVATCTASEGNFQFTDEFLLIRND